LNGIILAKLEHPSNYYIKKNMVVVKKVFLPYDDRSSPTYPSHPCSLWDLWCYSWSVWTDKN